MKVKKLPLSILKDYPGKTACLKIRMGSVIRYWCISADPNKDNESTLIAHLKLHLPQAKLLGWVIK